MQHLVFQIVDYLWPGIAPDASSLMVVASTNAQAKNISFGDTKAHTMHATAKMRVQKYSNAKMRAGNQLTNLQNTWRKTFVLSVV